MISSLILLAISRSDLGGEDGNEAGSWIRRTKNFMENNSAHNDMRQDAYNYHVHRVSAAADATPKVDGKGAYGLSLVLYPC